MANRRRSDVPRVFTVPLKSVQPHIVRDGRVAAKRSAAEGGDLCPRHSIPSVSIGSAARSRLIRAGLWPLPPEVAVFDVFQVTGGSAGPGGVLHGGRPTERPLRCPAVTVP